MAAPTTQTSGPQSYSRTVRVRTAVVASDVPDERVLQTVADAGNYDMIVVEPLAHAYSRIKLMRPSIVIVPLSFDELNAFHLMSMLKLDPDTAGIPLVTALLETTLPESGAVSAEYGRSLLE